MTDTFHDALIWHMKTHGTKISELAKGAGVTEGSIKQIRARPGSGTGATTGARIAAFYGKTYDEFLRCEEPEGENSFTSLVALLTDEEREILFRQVRGMIAGRD